MSCPLHDCVGVLVPCLFLSGVDTEDLEALKLLNYRPVYVYRVVLGPLFPVVCEQLLCHIEGVVVVLAPHCQVSDLLPIGCLIVIGDQGKLNDGVRVVHGSTVVGEQGVKEGPPC